METMKRCMIALGWLACAAAVQAAPPAIRAPAIQASMPSGSRHVDAVVPSGRNLFLFDFAQSRYQKWNLSRGPADSLGLCRVLDTLAGNWSEASRWLALSAPSRPFVPMKAFWGPSGNFFLLDRAGKRLAIYDTNAQFLSSLPLPPEIRDRNLDRFEMFWTLDGQFTFLDLGEGTLWQYAEMRTSGGGDWRLRNTQRLPMGLETCLWEPYFRAPCCLKAGKGVCYDKYFNPVGPWPVPAEAPGILPRAASRDGGWRLILDGGRACGSRPPACYLPDKAAFSTCPPDPVPAPPR
jgi:hypothetical protein